MPRGPSCATRTESPTQEDNVNDRISAAPTDSDPDMDEALRRVREGKR
ncbi:hypothetical protein GCM10027075_77530 [Streptomyces heilongjiangensis]